VLTSRISLGEGLYRQPERRAQFYAEALRHTAALPGVRDASFASDLPLSGAVSAAFQFDVKEKNPARATGDAQLALYNAVSPDYFRAMGIPMLAGRAFTDADRSGAPKVVVVSESLAKAYWPGENPLGKHVNVSSSLPNPEWSEVVGVAGDTRHFSPAAEPSEELYAPLQQEPPLGAYLIVRSVGDPVTIAGALRGAIAGVDSNEPVSELLTMEQRLSTSISPQRFRTILLSIFAGLALLLSAAGIFGVISYWATQRTREIGIRMALGAKRSDVLRLVLGQGMRLTAIGVGLGLAAAFAFSRFIASLLLGVGPDDPLTFAGVTLVLTGVSALACWIPARRAARVDPIVALRHD
jgi:predicted permease